MSDKPTREQLENRIRELEQMVHDLGSKLGKHAMPCAQCTQPDMLDNLHVQTILDLIPNPVWLKDKQLRFIAINKAYERQCDRPASQILGKTDADIWPAHMSPGFIAKDKEVMRTGKAVTVQELVSYGNSGVRLHETFKAPIFDASGEVVGTTGIGHDISKLKATEERLTHVNDLLHELQKLSSTGGWEFDRTSRRSYWTDNHYRLYGYEPGEVSGSFLFFLRKVVHPEDLGKVRTCFRDAMTTGKRVDMDYRAVCKDGSIKFIKSVILPDLQQDGSVSRLYGVALDITPFHEVQMDLIKAKDEAEAATRAKSEFLANMSHEIRTPLNGVLGMLQLLSRAALSEEDAGSVQVALDSGRGLLTIINDVLNLSKLEAGKMELRNRPFSVQRLVESLDRLFQFPAAKAKTTLRFDVDRNVPCLLAGDKERLRQTLFNLIGNAIKFTEGGNIDMTVSRLPYAPKDHVQLLFILADTGIGIDPERIDFVLRPFTQVDGSLSRKHHGTGLGMHIVRRTVQLMKGTLTLDSVPGKGTTVYLSLPLHPVENYQECVKPLAGEFAMVTQTSLRVLVVEDERVNRLTATRFLERMGHVPTTANSGEEGLEKLRQGSYDVILMDIQMPGKDGLETTRIIRSDDMFAECRTIPIIALTAYAMEGDREKFMEAGMDDYLAKPLEMEELQRKLEAISLSK